MLKFLEAIAQEQSIGNIADATVILKNKNGTYDIKLKGGAVKRKVRNISNQTFTPNTSVTIILPHGRKSHVRIIGKGLRSTKTTKIVNI